MSDIVSNHSAEMDEEIKPLSDEEKAKWANFGGIFIEAPQEANGQVAATARYEWKDEYGDVPPRIPELEEWLFKGVVDANASGDKFEDLFAQEAIVQARTGTKPVTSFEDAGLHPAMLENIKLAGYAVPTPIQQYCIPVINQGLDLMSCAQTGSGKTAAFLIPILSRLMGKAKKLAAPRQSGMPYLPQPLVLIIAPTRELATQLFKEALKLCYRSMLRPCVVYGGADFKVQQEETTKGCDILVGTPGRLLDFLERRLVSLQRTRYVVIDEADEMLDMGFGPQLRRIMHQSDANEDDDLQVMMFSATYQPEIRDLAADFLKEDFVQVSIGRVGSTHKRIGQTIMFVEEQDKRKSLMTLLGATPPCLTLIFVNDKRTADNLDFFLHHHGLPVTSIHGGRNQYEREDALTAFRCGKTPIMIATGVAARGLDIKNVMHVINYDMPKGIDEYVHRIGRTARIGNSGFATSFFTAGDEPVSPDLLAILRESEQPLPDFLVEMAANAQSAAENQEGEDVQEENVDW